ncbi:IscS subfamily cysteine desulfurase [Chitinophagaceae bacterium LB-8]|uniref:cysteine desulfurase n=1 Tax=Paraflavisolibacter caeni TaxID=2982496 RepID=A0A9X2XU80_9BACT|nr:IscS subfamily cysteine desulfurase [Paraflavisolibacter caeni]MCU7548447.1 IscS subfamily cysteine desulfurase [Paraflavisolibacter caeni]
MLELPVYLDHNSTTPCDHRVVEAMLPFFTRDFGNAASHSHAFGWKAKEAVDYAREQVANLIGASSGEIIFTSGATEADNLAIKGVFEMYAGKGNHIITSGIEHKAVLDTCRHLEKLGAEITYLPVSPEGFVDLNKLESAIKPTTILIAIMYANNEIGTIMPVREIGFIARKHGVLFFTDATQAVGKIPVHVDNDNIDLLAMTAHKLYGPKGTGALYVRRKGPRVRLTAQMDGGGHEKGLRSGTLNVPGIVGLGKACQICQLEMSREAERLSKLRDQLEQALLGLGQVFVNGSKQNRLPQVTNLCFKDVDSNGLMMALQKNIAVSSGSACTSATPEPSYVLKALGLSDELAHSSLRFSLGRKTMEEEIDYTIEQVSKTVHKLRGELTWSIT